MSDNQDYTNNEKIADSSIRDHLVETAVNFLLNPDVRQRHDDSKINFLKKKGLTNAEISAAFDRVKLDSRYANSSVSSDLTNKLYHTVPSAPYQGYSFLSRLTGLSSSLIIFGVAIYGLHHLYKKFIRPWLLNEDEESLNPIKELTKNLALLTETVEKLHATVMKQNEEINKLLQIEGCGYAPTPVILEDVKREVSSLKSILISRHQFPAMPQTQTIKATIPSWQLPSNETQSTDEDMNSTCLPFETNLSSSDGSINSLLPHSDVKPKDPGANEMTGLEEDTKADNV
ncbi:peroxisomal membrane protein PEX14 [Parasteatoda tepidariorum]|uniref:peroxisomal membrane protein PEX14 n=1 Tax=Parasteatoda tepidariorum TaxID=114398 RepID=UPI001C71E06A|nr:peroxisomal membrane protein PEX14 [Parasteatoda tepidariorum]